MNEIAIAIRLQMINEVMNAEVVCNREKVYNGYIHTIYDYHGN
ncbi:MAG: hypothetical protein ACUVRK_10285 [Spirochaetota bacterium]